MALRAVYPRLTRQVQKPVATLGRIGDHTLFYGKAMTGIPFALTHYRREIIRLIAEISMGAGTLAMIGGTVVIVGFLTLATGGVLAIQMPDNRQEPTHRLMRALAAEAPWAEPIGDADSLRTLLLPLGGYYDLLAPHAASVDVWHTIYQHRMADAASIVEWVRSTGLKPFVDRLPVDLQASYLAEYQRRVDEAYPARADGKRLLAFPRMFIVAQKGRA